MDRIIVVFDICSVGHRFSYWAFLRCPRGCPHKTPSSFVRHKFSMKFNREVKSWFCLILVVLVVSSSVHNKIAETLSDC